MSPRWGLGLWGFDIAINMPPRWGYIGSFLLGCALPNLRLVAIGRGEVSSPDGLGDPTPTGSGCEVSAVFNLRNPLNPFNPRFRQLSPRWGYAGSLFQVNGTRSVPTKWHFGFWDNRGCD